MNDCELPFSLDLTSCAPTVQIASIPTKGSPSSPIWIAVPACDLKGFNSGDPGESTYNYRIATVLEQASIRSGDIFWTTIDPQPASDFMIARSRPIPQERVEDFLRSVEKHQPKVLIAVGEPALRALTSEKNIDKWRGSFLPLDHPEGYALDNTLVLPIQDGYRLFQAPELSFVMQIDLRKIAVRLSPDYRAPIRDYKIEPTFEEAVSYLLYLRDECPSFAVDIETPQQTLGCIGFSDAPYQAFCLPFLKWGNPGQHYWPADQEAVLWRLLSQVLANPASEKVFQNGMFDTTFLWEVCGIMTRGRIWDTMVMHHLLYPDFPSNLGFLTSLYTLDPFYKDEGKIEEKNEGDNHQYWTYNAKDTDTTYRIYNTLQGYLAKHGHKPISDHLSLLHTPIFQMSIRGFAVDLDRRARRSAELTIEMEETKRKLDASIGYSINLNSPDQVKEWLYVSNGLHEKTKTRVKTNKLTGAKERSSTATADAGAIRELKKELQGMHFAEGGERDRWRHKLIYELDLVLALSEMDVRMDFLKAALWKGRFHSSFVVSGAETGRLKSKKYKVGWPTFGGNLQNRNKKDRVFLVPDPAEPGQPPFVLVNADLSQAEARIVAWESNDPGLKQLFNSGVDYHTANAKNIFGLASIDDVTPEQRQAAKIGGHGTNYDMSSPTLALQLGVSLAFAKNFHASYKAAYPYIPMWHNKVRQTLLKTRTVSNLYGRKYRMLGRIDDSAYRNALAFTPQSSIADLIDHIILDLVAERPEIRLHVQGHDSLVFSVPYPEVDAFIPWLRAHMERPLCSSHGELFTIPADFEVGWNWKDMVRYLTPAEEASVKELFKAIPDDAWTHLPAKEQKELLAPYIGNIVAELGVNKDAVSALYNGQTWRTI
jgi:DNA polymerase I-like protein with 3'-5' exonuclease and polymerase domains